MLNVTIVISFITIVVTNKFSQTKVNLQEVALFQQPL